ncbi:MAG: serine/threonine-protein kinase, partial [Candidatus Brocadiia bacterium]|nr:serine/threonine-protein kinase [Candidatus Brocadiia bacterium]
MEFVEGTTLRDMMRAERVGPEFMIKIFRQCGETLKYAHSKGIIHRDIKPANIMLDDQSNVKIADFGVAGIIATAQQSKRTKRWVVGTPGYMAPEQQIDVVHTDQRSDIFSLGAVLYQVLTRKLPEVLPPEPPSKVNTDVDPRLDNLVLKCLKESPGERFQSADEFLEALEAYHVEVTRVGEVCPACKSENPATQKTCLKCGADLSELFDVCPDCEADNRRDVDICVGCGVNLTTVREKIAVMIAKRREKARALAGSGRYDEAAEALKIVLQVRGKLYERARARAERAIEKYAQQRTARYQKVLQKGQTLADRGDLPGAIEVWCDIPAEAVPDGDPAELIRKAEGAMAECEALVKQAGELLEGRQHREASALLAKVGAAWARCPGLAESRVQLETVQQAEQVIEYGLNEVDRLVTEGDFAGAREALEFSQSSAPDDPRMKQKFQELDLKGRQSNLNGLVAAAKAMQQEGRHLAAARGFRQAAELLDDSDPTKAQLLERAGSERERARPEDEPTAPMARERARREVVKRTGLGAGQQRRRRTILTLTLVGAAVAAIAAVVILVSLLGSGPETPGSGESPPANAILPPEPPPTERYFTENFDDGAAQYWAFAGERWNVLPEADGGGVLSDAFGRRKVAEHRWYEEQEVGAEAWVAMEAGAAPGRGGSADVALSVRREEGTALELRIELGEGGAEARLSAVVRGRPVKQTDPFPLSIDANGVFEGTLRIDAAGGAAARVDGELVGVLLGLPKELARAGKVALEAAYCRALWDDVVLAGPVEGNIPTQWPLPPPPPPPPPPKRLFPVSAVEAAPGTAEVDLSDYTLMVRQSFEHGVAGWQAAAGEWALVGRGRYGPAGLAGGTSVFALGEFQDVEIEAQAAAVAFRGDSNGKFFGLMARRKDGENYVFFGLVGTGEDEWAVQLVACKRGRKKTLTAPGGPYALPAGDVALRLTIRGGRACGYVGGKPVLSESDIAGLAPAVGRPGLAAQGLAASFDDVALKVRQSVKPSFPGSGRPRPRIPGTVPLTVPEGVDVKAAEPPGLIALGDSGTRYVLLEHLESPYGSMSARMRLSSPQEYPALSICAARRKNDVAFAAMDIDLAGYVRVRLARRVSGRTE